MKKFIITTLSMLVLSHVWAQQTNVQGTWLGVIDVGVKLRLVFHIEKDKAGLYSATMDSPDQNAKGIPVSGVSVSGDSVHVNIGLLPASFRGKIINDTTIAGIFKQGPASLPLSLIKTEKIKELNRPQTPKSPLGYAVEEVEYDNGDKTVHLGATLTKPSSGDRFPAVILISGSGQQDRNSTILGHQPFAVIANYLTKMGFAVLRVDDRGTGKSTGDVRNATSANFADDVQTSLQWLRNRQEIDKSKIGLIGHSEGGLIAFIVASRDRDIDFVITLAGPGVTGLELMALQNEALYLKQNVSPVSASAYKELYAEIAGVAITDTSSDLMAVAMELYKGWKNRQTQQALAELQLAHEKDAKNLIAALIDAFRQKWISYFLQSDAQKFAAKTDVKMLALFGEKDIQVLPKENSEGIRSVLKKRKKTNYSIKILPGLNHLFQTCNTCSPAEYGDLEETFSPLALREMGDWLKANVLRK